jgi:methylmalonyl-CoA/ethylmalonyl-CoA epimerase
VDHLGIAVKSLEKRLRFWADALNLDVAGIESVESEQVKVALLPVGRTRIELLEPTDADSAIGRFLEKHGEGIHHVTLEVSDIELALERLREKEVRILEPAPRTGAEGRKVAFLHPASTGGVLVELAERVARETTAATISPGQPVLVYLREPSEKLWGILRRLDASGLMLEGIDLSSFDDWVAQIERGEESVVGPSVLFVPTPRLEKVLLDRSSGKLPSIAERFHRRIGRSVQEVLLDESAAGEPETEA